VQAIQTLKSELNGVTTSLSEQAVKHQQVQQQLDNALKELMDLRTSNASKAASIKVLFQEASDASAKHCTDETAIFSLNQDLKSAKAQVGDLTSKLETCKYLMSNAQINHDKVKTDAQITESEKDQRLHFAECEITKLRTELAVRDTAMGSASHQFGHAQTEIERLKAELAKSQAALKSEKEEYIKRDALADATEKKLKTDIALINTEKTSEVSELQDKLQASQGATTALSSKVTNLETEMDSKVTKLRDELRASQDTNTSLKNEMDLKVLKLESEFQDCRTLLEDRSSELSDVEVMLTAAENEVAALKSELADSEKHLDDSKAKIFELKTALDCAERDAELYQEQSETFQEELKDSKTKVTNIQTLLATTIDELEATKNELEGVEDTMAINEVEFEKEMEHSLSVIEKKTSELEDMVNQVDHLKQDHAIEIVLANNLIETKDTALSILQNKLNESEETCAQLLKQIQVFEEHRTAEAANDLIASMTVLTVSKENGKSKRVLEDEGDTSDRSSESARVIKPCRGKKAASATTPTGTSSMDDLIGQASQLELKRSHDIKLKPATLADPSDRILTPDPAKLMDPVFKYPSEVEDQEYKPEVQSFWKGGEYSIDRNIDNATFTTMHDCRKRVIRTERQYASKLKKAEDDFNNRSFAQQRDLNMWKNKYLDEYGEPREEYKSLQKKVEELEAKLRALSDAKMID
jgi:chromosome segregation ATPase